ncbi:FtsX-like permease family protein [Kribbella sp. NPDC051770]|uniref:FtsX-like permease family protein n=1 Tax=Kribbella sp. NPDC051770 TaxID=3155413 RepID=UPI00342B51CE
MSLPLSTTLHLARTRTPADRSRVRLATVALAFSGALVLNAIHVMGMGPGDLDSGVYSNYIAEVGLRSGLGAILIVLAVLSGGLAAQALRIGTAAREQRISALRLAGASKSQVRRLSVADAGLVGLAGGLLAGPMYMLLTGVFSQLPRMARLFPGLGAWDFLAWLFIVGLLTLGGVLLGFVLHRDQPRASDQPDIAPDRVWPVVGLGLAVAGATLTYAIGYFGAAATVIGLGMLWWSGSAGVSRVVGRRLMQSGDPVKLLTGARLVADARPAARMGTLLFCCGFLVGAMLSSLLGVMHDRPDWQDQQFFITGFGLSMVGVLLIAVIALAAFTVGMADQLVNQRRQLASLTALGVGDRLLRRVIHRELMTTAAPTLCAGLVAGVLTGLWRLIGNPDDESSSLGTTLIAVLALLVLGWAVATAGAALAGFLLRNQLRDALDPENLRAA